MRPAAPIRKPAYFLALAIALGAMLLWLTRPTPQQVECGRQRGLLLEDNCYTGD